MRGFNTLLRQNTDPCQLIRHPKSDQAFSLRFRFDNYRTIAVAVGLNVRVCRRHKHIDSDLSFCKGLPASLEMLGKAELIFEDADFVFRLRQVVVAKDKWDVYQKIALRCQFDIGEIGVENFTRFDEISQNDF